MNRLIHTSASGAIKVCDVYHTLISLEGIPTNLIGLVHKLKDYEATGYNPDFIDTIPYILQDMAELLENPTTEHIKACKSKIDYILNAKDKAAN
jgi:hypothetical protein